MPVMDIFTETTQQQILDTLKLQNSLVSIIAKGYNINSFKAVQEIVKSGQASKIFTIGDQFISPWTDTAADVTYQVPWDIKHFGTIEDEDGEIHPAMFIQWHWCTPFAMQFDKPEEYVATEANFTEGYYYYIKNDNGFFTQQTVTYGAPIPSLTTYYKSIFNKAASVLYHGYNRWSHSAIRQWLNSDAIKEHWWTAQHEGDIASDQANTKDGFIKGLAADLLEIIQPIKVVTARNTVTDDGGLDVTYDRFFLPSVEQMYGQKETDGEGEYWTYWKNATGWSKPYNSKNNGRIHYDISQTTTPQTVLLRSAERTYSCKPYDVSMAGTVGGGLGADSALWCAPAAAIW